MAAATLILRIRSAVVTNFFRLPPCGGGDMIPFALLLRRSIGIDHGAGLVLRRPQDRLHAAVAELLEIAGRDMLELREQCARMRPVAILAISKVADQRHERMMVHVISEPGSIEALGALDSLRQYLPGRIAERH